MSSVYVRTVRSSPHRDVSETWATIIDLIANREEDRAVLNAIAGEAASIIADRAPLKAAIVLSCDGPQTRIRCTYDEAALDGSGENEATLGYDPLAGNWHVSLPCQSDDIEWLTKAIAAKTARVTVRDMNESATTEKAEAALDAGELKPNLEEMLKS